MGNDFVVVIIIIIHHIIKIIIVTLTQRRHLNNGAELPFDGDSDQLHQILMTQTAEEREKKKLIKKERERLYFAEKELTEAGESKERQMEGEREREKETKKRQREKRGYDRE